MVIVFILVLGRKTFEAFGALPGRGAATTCAGFRSVRPHGRTTNDSTHPGAIPRPATRLEDRFTKSPPGAGDGLRLCCLLGRVGVASDDPTRTDRKSVV